MSGRTASPEEELDGVFPPRGRDEVVLEVDDVSVGFGGVQALQKVSCRVRRGDVVAVIGPNGAGKTTLLNTICGLSRADMTGQVRYRGEEISTREASSIIASGIGRSFQSPPLLENESVVDNVVGGMHHTISYGIFSQVFRPGHVRRTERDLRLHALRLLELVGLASVADEPAGSQPYGSRKLIDIARALAAAPDLLLLDEPTSGLDNVEQERVRLLLHRLHAGTGITVLLVEHHMDLVRAVATSVLGLAAGAVIRYGDPIEVLDSAEFRAAVVGDH